MQWTRDTFRITDRPEDLDIDVIHGFLTESYWAKGIPKSLVEKSLEHSLCCGLFHAERQIGFGRAVTDYTSFAYLADVFVLPDYRGRGLGKWLVSCILAHPQLQGLRRWLLATKDAHTLYQRQGFEPLSKPDWFMEVIIPDMYQRKE